MKQACTFYLAFLVVLTMNAQDYTHSLDGVEWVKIESKSDVTVKTHDKNVLLIDGGKSRRAPSRADGLKLVGAGGSDNTDVGFNVIKEGSNLIVRNLRKSEGAEIYLPASQNISIKSTWHGDIEVDGFVGEVEASAQLNGGVSITDVTGPVTANSLNGGVEVSFTKVSQESPITICSTNGALDINLPGNTPADLSLSSVNGEIYTNFDISVPEKNGLRAVSTSRVKGAINNGGVTIKLCTTNGNIYLRKQ